MHRIHREGTLLEVEHVRHIVQRRKRKCTELANDGAMMDEGEMAQIRGTVQHKREEVHAALPYAARFYCLVEEWHDCEEVEPTPKKVSLRTGKEKA